VNHDIGTINKNNKIENFLKPLDMTNSGNLLRNINPEELYYQNNNNTNTKIEQKKKKLLEDFINSFNNSKYIKKEPSQIFPEKTNLIDIIGKIYFPEDLFPQSEIEVTIYYPRQFEALRIAYCCTYEDLIISITKSNAWTDVSGGKSKASFYKTKDEKYLFKSINKNEFNMFLEIAFYYFQHIDEYLFHKMPSVLMKILGVYKIRIKKTDKGETTIENYYLMMMENLNYGFPKDKQKIKSYDLKGSTINRYIRKKEQKENLVLLDSNFKEDFNNEPIPLEKDLYGLLLVSVYNDTLFLSKMGIVDYSLLLYINDKNNDKSNDKDNNLKHSLIRVGIIDYIRRYTWDKKLEHFVKTIINGFNSPTIINPKDYKERFIAAIQSYFIGI
jgi:1-phosphatidylinositol-3-phosphate 5-kinase